MSSFAATSARHPGAERRGGRERRAAIAAAQRVDVERAPVAVRARVRPDHHHAAPDRRDARHLGIAGAGGDPARGLPRRAAVGAAPVVHLGTAGAPLLPHDVHGAARARDVGKRAVPEVVGEPRLARRARCERDGFERRRRRNDGMSRLDEQRARHRDEVLLARRDGRRTAGDQVVARQALHQVDELLRERRRVRPREHDRAVVGRGVARNHQIEGRVGGRQHADRDQRLRVARGALLDRVRVDVDLVARRADHADAQRQRLAAGIDDVPHHRGERSRRDRVGGQDHLRALRALRHEGVSGTDSVEDALLGDVAREHPGRRVPDRARGARVMELPEVIVAGAGDRVVHAAREATLPVGVMERVQRRRRDERAVAEHLDAVGLAAGEDLGARLRRRAVREVHPARGAVRRMRLEQHRALRVRLPGGLPGVAQIGAERLELLAQPHHRCVLAVAPLLAGNHDHVRRGEQRVVELVEDAVVGDRNEREALEHGFTDLGIDERVVTLGCVVLLVRQPGVAAVIGVHVHVARLPRPRHEIAGGELAGNADQRLLRRAAPRRERGGADEREGKREECERRPTHRSLRGSSVRAPTRAVHRIGAGSARVQWNRVRIPNGIRDSMRLSRGRPAIDGL